jgi:hypothetical protein
MKKLNESLRIRKSGFNPALSDSEIITMELVSEFLGIDTDKGAWEYIMASRELEINKDRERNNFLFLSN